MVRKMAEQRRAQKAAELRARIREHQEDRRCVVCLCYHAPTELHLQRMFRVHAGHTKLQFPKKELNTTIRMWCCKGRVHMACVLQSMHSQYGRANKHLWRCVHCRRHLMDSRDDDVFHIGINDVDSLDPTITRKSNTCTGSRNSLQNNSLGTRVSRTLPRSRL